MPDYWIMDQVDGSPTHYIFIGVANPSSPVAAQHSFVVLTAML